jgi:hypothetical protein
MPVFKKTRTTAKLRSLPGVVADSNTPTIRTCSSSDKTTGSGLAFRFPFFLTSVAPSLFA